MFLVHQNFGVYKMLDYIVITMNKNAMDLGKIRTGSAAIINLSLWSLHHAHSVISKELMKPLHSEFRSLITEAL